MGEMSAGFARQRHELFTWLEESVVSSDVRRASSAWLNVRMPLLFIKLEQFERSVLANLLYLVDVLSAWVETSADVPFRVLIRKAAADSFVDRF